MTRRRLGARWASMAAFVLGAITVAACAPPSPGGGGAREAEVTRPTPVELLAPPTRPRRRMNIDQLGNAIAVATGGLVARAGNQNLFEVFADTLGKPNFLNSTEEDLDPTMVFQKFLDDAARGVCSELADIDLERPAPERALFIALLPGPHPETTAIDENLKALLLRYHGRRVAPTDPEHAAWRWLYDSTAHVVDDPLVVWRTICVALITHPDFYMY